MILFAPISVWQNRHDVIKLNYGIKAIAISWLLIRVTVLLLFSSPLRFSPQPWSYITSPMYRRRNAHDVTALVILSLLWPIPKKSHNPHSFDCCQNATILIFIFRKRPFRVHTSRLSFKCKDEVEKMG
jgi:hypothetical protein